MSFQLVFRACNSFKIMMDDEANQSQLELLRFCGERLNNAQNERMRERVFSACQMWLLGLLLAEKELIYFCFVLAKHG